MGNKQCMLNVGKGSSYSNDMHICNYYNDNIFKLEFEIINNKLNNIDETAAGDNKKLQDKIDSIKNSKRYDKCDCGDFSSEDSVVNDAPVPINKKLMIFTTIVTILLYL